MTNPEDFRPNGCIRFEQGVFHVRDPEPGGESPLVRPDPHLCLTVNGTELSGPVRLKADDKIEVQVLNRPQIRALEIDVDRDGLAASGRIRLQAGRTLRLLDSDWQETFRPELFVESETRPAPFTREEVLSELARRKIRFGISEASVDRLVRSPGETVPLASGIAPTEGQNGFVVHMFKTGPQTPAKARIDYWSKNTIRSVEKGALLAVRTPAVPGKPGRNVYGGVLPPPAVKDPGLKAGKGTRLSEDGLSLFSAMDGEVVEKSPFLLVEPVHTVYGDIDLSTGHVDFVGNVVVHGNVTEGMRVKAGGDVTVYGNVSKARIEAGGSVQIGKRVFDSKVSAGMRLLHLQKLHEAMTRLLEFLKTIESLLVQVRETLPDPSFFKSRFAPLLGKLLEENFPDFAPIAFSLEDLIQAHQDTLDPALVSELLQVKQKYMAYDPEKPHSMATCSADIRSLEALTEALAIEASANEIIEVLEAQKSVFQTTGDFRVHGRGCVNCRVKTLGNVFIDKAPGVFRGGEISFSREARILEVGSSGGAVTHLRSGRGGKVFFNKAYFNTVFHFNEVEKKLETTQTRGMAFLNQSLFVSIVNL